MLVTVLVLIISFAVLAPLFGADTRDGLDWAPDNQRDLHHLPGHHPGIGRPAQTRRTLRTKAAVDA